MRRIFTLIAAMAVSLTAATPALAVKCSDEEKAPIRLGGWQAEKQGDATTLFSLSLDSNLPKPTRMISGYVTFKDALNQDMGAFKFPRDYTAPADAAFKVDVPVGSMVVERATTIAKDDISARVCIEGVIYEDGTKEEFN